MAWRGMTIRRLMALVLAAGLATWALTLGWRVSGEVRRHDHVFAVVCENGAPGLGFANHPAAPFWPVFGQRALEPLWSGPRPCMTGRQVLAESCSLDHPEIHASGGISWTADVAKSFDRAQADWSDWN